MKKRIREFIKRLFIYLGIVIALGLLLLPFSTMIINSLMTEREIYSNNYPDFHIFPRNFTLEHYKSLFTEDPRFYRSFFNSLKTALPVTFIVTVIASLAAYSLSRFRLRRRNLLLFVFLFTSMVPTMGILIPYYLGTLKIGLYDRTILLIITYLAYISPFAIWIMKSFFDTIPENLEDAATVDGCTHLQTLRLIILPLSLPGIAAVSVFAFINTWGEFLIALVLSEDKAQTFPVWIGTFVGMYQVEFGKLITAGVLSCLPVVVVALIFQRFVIRGLIEGAVKG